MTRPQTLYNKAKSSPNNFPFSDLCTLAEKVGFVFRNQKGSHKMYKHPKFNKMMNFQPNGNKATSYQIKQLLNFIDENDLIGESNV